MTYVDIQYIPPHLHTCNLCHNSFISYGFLICRLIDKPVAGGGSCPHFNKPAIEEKGSDEC